MTKRKDPALLKRKRRGRPSLNPDGSKADDLRIRLPKDLTTRLAVVCSGRKMKLPVYIRQVLDETLPPLEPIKLPPLPPAPPLDPAEVLRLAKENPGFPEDPSDHEDPPFYYDPASGTYFP